VVATLGTLAQAIDAAELGAPAVLVIGAVAALATGSDHQRWLLPALLQRPVAAR